MCLNVRLKMSLAAESFTENVERFCEWAEAEKHGLIEARQHLLALATSIPRLENYRESELGDDELPRRGYEGWKEDHERFGDLPFQYYMSVFDSHDLENRDEPVTGDLHDDFADIYGDLWRGLEAHKAGRIKEALSIWIESYFCHWGNHAASALKAIDDYYRRNR